MKFGVVNKSATVNRFVFHTLQRNITHLAVITRITNIKLVFLKGGKLEKSQNSFHVIHRRARINFFLPCQTLFQCQTNLISGNKKSGYWGYSHDGRGRILVNLKPIRIVIL